MDQILEIAGRERDLGGFSVRRVLPYAKKRMVGPFTFFDQMGPAQFAPGQGIDVRPHPHIGLATVTYLFEGALQHRDSLGEDLVIRPGAVNWMTAGHGVVHSERSPSPERENGHRMYGIQTWVALPEADEDVAPAFHHHPAETIPVIEREEVRFDLILGTAWGSEAAVAVFSPIFYLHSEMAADSAFTMDVEHEERAIYLVEGDLSVDGQTLEAGSMFVLPENLNPRVSTKSGARIMMCGGAPVGERKIYWNFVASSAERLEQAKADWTQASENGFPSDGRFHLPRGESEHIPLPDN
ncbi:pirin family protein [Maricaulis sp. MIT060901]|uniref:pirin family protein n=1 Tax=Maricaulis sp. MIT060901 TaxID=3096993 RepID=UPI00399B71A9